MITENPRYFGVSGCPARQPKSHATRSRAGRWRTALAATFLSCTAASGLGQSLYDFGYQRMTLNGQLPLGNRPLLVILVQFAADPQTGLPIPFTHDVNYFDSLIFNFLNPTTPLNMNRFYLENSNGRFFWSRGGIIGPLAFAESERRIHQSSDEVFYANIIRRAMTSGLFNFLQYDTNGDNVIQMHELQLMVVTNDGTVEARNAGLVGAPGVPFLVDVRSAPLDSGLDQLVAGLSDHTEFSSRCHELAHTLGALDVYGSCSCNSSRLTTMGATRCEPPCPDQVATWHLDPWHKMALGWCEPRIVSINAGGTFELPATQMLDWDAPLILYDPARGTNEFFMLEYRTTTSPNGSGYDQDVAGNGLVVWHVMLGSRLLALLPGDPHTYVHWSEGAPNFQRGSNAVWTNATPSGYLTWLDGSQSRARFQVHPFSSGSASITIDLLVTTWVDFNYGGAERGTFDAPFNTLAEGVANVPIGGTLRIKTGASSERMTINRQMTIEAHNGLVVLGQ